MYGLLLEAIYDFVKTHLSEEAWVEIVSRSGIEQTSFVTHGCYAESILPKIAKTAADLAGVETDEMMENFGVYFVTFISKYGYDTILRVLGRHMRDFLNGLDNLHEYLRLSYPKMQAPSFFCDNETSHGLMLHYRSKRKGFIHYVMGQIRQVGALFYDTQIEIEVLRNENENGRSHVIMKLHFDNKGFDRIQKKKSTQLRELTLRSESFFKMFPFHIVFTRDMTIRHIGKGLKAIMPNLVGKRLDHAFDLTKPPVNFTFDNIYNHTNNIFEIVALTQVTRRTDVQRRNNTSVVSAGMDNSGPRDRQQTGRAGDISHNSDSDTDDVDESYFHIRLKGQMRFMPNWDAFIYLATPILENLEKMYQLGLYINDLSMHDASRDMVLVGTAHSKELKSALNQARQKSRKLEEIIRLLDTEVQRSDTLLYQMIPKDVADRLRSGLPSVDTCQVIEEVSILFSEVIDFTQVCASIQPMEVVTMLNSMYTKFDNLTEVHRVYKVETIGDAYMVVSGAPNPTRLHALMLADMSLDMLEAIQSVPNPDPGSDGHIKVKIGMHSGTVVAGVVGLRMPRYCLFGDSVNTASRMESNSMAMKIHISETSKKCLQGYPYLVEEREIAIQVKGKGSMKTYWLTGRNGPGCNQLQEYSPELRRASSRLDFGGDDSSLDRGIDRAHSRCTYTPVTYDPVRDSATSSRLDLNGSGTNFSPTDENDMSQSMQRVEMNGAYGQSVNGCATKVCHIM